MSKHDKDYDTTMARFVGNLIAGQSNWPAKFGEAAKDAETRQRELVDQAIVIARYVRKQLRKDAEGEQAR